MNDGLEEEVKPDYFKIKNLSLSYHGLEICHPWKSQLWFVQYEVFITQHDHYKRETHDTTNGIWENKGFTLKNHGFNKEK